MNNREVFADTYYWQALIDRADAGHAAAVRMRQQLGSRHIVTSELVLVELLDAMCGAGPHTRAATEASVHCLMSDRNVTVIPMSRSTLSDAMKIYARCPLKITRDGSQRSLGWSLTDCASFQIMHARGIRDALTADRHFDQAGFVRLLD